MEKTNFPSQALLPKDHGLRDLPPAESDPLSRMDMSQGGGCDCQPICTGYEGCAPGSLGLCERPLAMVYAPCQHFRALYDPATALSRGTLFTELDLPLGGEGGFTAVGCACRFEGAERRQS